MERLDQRLGDSAGTAAITALQGTGGIGKTQLAVRYCYDKQRKYPGGIVWISGTSGERALADLVGYAEELADIVKPTDASERAKARALLGRLRRKDALIVVDNLKEANLLSRDLPGVENSRFLGLGCKLLVTSRNPVPGQPSIQVNFLPLQAAQRVLLRSANRDSAPESDAQTLKNLLATLGGLPLALVIAGNMLATRPELSFARLLQKLRDRGAVTGT